MKIGAPVARQSPLIEGTFGLEAGDGLNRLPRCLSSGARPLCRAGAWLAVVRVARFLREVKELQQKVNFVR